MQSAKPLRILYFINRPAPSQAEREDAERYGYGVAFRNAQHVPQTGALEQCDGVAGQVPARYAAAFRVAVPIMQRSSLGAALLSSERTQAVEPSPSGSATGGEGANKAAQPNTSDLFPSKKGR